MLYVARSFWHPKSLECAHEYEDAYALGPSGVVAVSDGVSSAIFSRQWAQLLTSEVAENPPDLGDPAAFQAWLADLRARWRASIDLSQLAWNQRQKLQQVGGAYATLLWAEFYPADFVPDPAVEPLDPPPTVRMRCFAVGDSCLFHVRDGQVLHKFPLDAVPEFEIDPITICSVNRNRDHLLEFQCLDDFCCEGDLVVLTSDALAKWIYQRLEAEEPVDWEWFWNMTEEDWNQRVAELRDLPAEQRMRIDDTTLVMLRVASAAEVAEPLPAEPEVTEPGVTEPEVAEPELTEPPVVPLATVTEGVGGEVVCAPPGEIPSAIPSAVEAPAEQGRGGEVEERTTADVEPGSEPLPEGTVEPVEVGPPSESPVGSDSIPTTGRDKE